VTGDVDPPRLFVYGTLQPGRLRWPLLEPFATGSAPASVPGALYDSGKGWPVAVFDGDPSDAVPGVLVDLDPHRLDAALELLDQVEGGVTDLVRRVVVTTTGQLAAWAYHWSATTAGMRRIARWDAPVERWGLWNG
jgi:gamma-glutamylcyclotransferase (GGCT)/AIG2-like uncharacterized protein YtfP